MEREIWDLSIIGGGPAGATAAIYASRAKLKTIVIDKAINAGALGVTSKIANYPGVNEVLTGERLLRIMWDQAEKFGTVIKRGRVAAAMLTEVPKKILTAEGDTYEAKVVILCTGAMGRSKVYPGEEEYLGRGVSNCATCDGAFFKDQPMLVYGHTEEALEEADFLTRFASKLYVATPKDDYKEHQELFEQVSQKPNVEFMYNRGLKEIFGNDNVKGAILVGPEGEVKLDVEAAFIYGSGNKPMTDYLFGTVKTDEQGYIVVDKDMQTNIPGVFACGDLLTNAVKQAVVAAAQGCIAALSADKYINKRKGFIRDYN